MDEEKNDIKLHIKFVLKPLSKIIKISLVIILIFIFAIVAIYTKFKNDFFKISEKSSNYKVSINANGELTVTKGAGDDEENGEGEKVTIDEMAGDLAMSFEKYIDGDYEYRKEKIRYLIEAELVTKYPYIDSFEEIINESSEEDKTERINGQIKFYRYKSEDEANNAYIDEENETINDAYRIKYISPEEFETKLSSYRESGNTEVLNYFTMNDEGAVVIATTSMETRTITTDDKDISLEQVKEMSGEESYTGDNINGFSMVRYNANEQLIDYLSIVQPYVMPSNLLYALLVQTRDISFVEDIAGLAYQNEIAVGIYDNEIINNNNEEITYKKLMQMNVNTDLNFDNILTTNPRITKNSLRSSPYSRIPKSCSSYTSAKEGRVNHQEKFLQDYEGTLLDEATDNYMYIMKVDDNNKIESLGKLDSAKTFTTNYKSQITSQSVPTKGVVLADTWIAKWKASYIKEDKEPISSSYPGTNDNTMTVEFTQNADVLDEFNVDMKNNISSQLDKHANELKQKAISKIIADAEANNGFVVDVYTIDDVPENTKKQILQTHLNSDNICQNIVNEWWNSRQAKANTLNGTNNQTNIMKIAVETLPIIPSPTPSTTPNIDVVYNEIVNNTAGTLSSGQVGQHYRKALQDYVNNENNRRQGDAQELKNNFEKELNEQITYEYKLNAKEIDTDINFTLSSERNSSQYVKSETIQREKEGEKFSEIFKDNKNYEAKEAILARTGWFWEYIRENEDTAKIEDIIRYLLNIATNSNAFGTFTAEDIENILLAFEPQELIMDNNSGGMSVHEYLAQYGGDYTVYEFEGVQYYAVINDTAGNPTVGAGDIQWRSNYDKYSATATLDNIQVGMLLGTGTVRQGNQVYENVDVMEKVNELLENGKDTKWEKNYKPPENKIIYIDKQTCDNVAENLAKRFYNETLINTDGLNLSRQQLYALTFIEHATGNLTYVATSENKSTARPFSVVFNEAAQLYEINSWEFNRYIWKNWWSTKWAGGYSNGRYYGGWLKSRDASFETYVKGTYNFGGTNQAGATRERNGYMFYSQEDISKIGFSSSPQKINRDKNNATAEEELFTYVETQNASVVVDFALQFEGKTASEIGLWGYKTSDGVSLDPNEWCAMFVSFCFDNCGMIDSIGGTYKSCSAKLNSMEENSNTKSQIINLREGYSNNYMPGYIPKAGDVIFFYWGESDARSDHTGIVVDCDGSTVYTIEGNTGASDNDKSIVKRKEYSVDSLDICAYLIPR